MTNCAQAVLIGTEIAIKCDGRWGCCQREQAKAKVEAMNRVIADRSPAVRPTLSSVPHKVYGNVRGAADAFAASAANVMDAAPDQAAEAKKRGSPDCLSKELAKPGKSRSSMDLQMDHPLDVKLGGLPGPEGALMPLDRSVNNAFGGFAKTTGNRLGAGQQVSKVTLLCPPVKPCPDHTSSPCPDKSVGNRTDADFKSYPVKGKLRKPATAKTFTGASY
ncbi:MAG: hypothetical protein KDE27_11605 [Planctomycetes bacterium]|nr:hypothetical protein [Planctomycetota bacterium]